MTPFATASSKINVDTDMQFVFTRAIADHVQAHDVNEKEHFDPRSWGHAAEAAMAAAVTERCALRDPLDAPSHAPDRKSGLPMQASMSTAKSATPAQDD